MALERGIALAVFAVGLAVVVLALAGCGGDDGDHEGIVACEDRNSSLPVMGARLVENGTSVRFAYAGAEPCLFAVDRYEGRLYVELRTATESGEIDRRPPLPTGCAIGILGAPMPSEMPVETVYGNRGLMARKELTHLLAQSSGCVEVEQGQAAFVID